MSDEVTREQAQSALLLAVLQGQHDHAERLLAAGCLPHYVYPSQETPFGMALGLGDLKMAALMLRHGASVNHQAVRGESYLPLIGAVTADLAEFGTKRVEFLLAHGADPRLTWKGQDGTTHDVQDLISGRAKIATAVENVTLADMRALLQQQVRNLEAAEARRREAVKAQKRFKL